MKSKAPTQTETDGVQYRRVSNARLALAMTSALSLACFFSAIGYVSYAANLGFGVTMLLVGTIMTVARLFDGITDPLISLLIDKVNTRFGKIRLFIIIGWAIEAFSLLCLYSWFCGKGHSVGVFILFYFLYYIGYTFHNMANNLISPVITNDPKQRPMVGVFSTIYNYVIVIVLSIIVSMVLLPQYGDNYTVDLLSKTAVLFVGLSAVFTVLAIIGVSPIDKPENFTSAQGKSQSIKGKDMLDLLKNNKALQCFIFAATSDKLAMNIAGQSVITTLLYGIIIGNVRIGAIMNMVAISPALDFLGVWRKIHRKARQRQGRCILEPGQYLCKPCLCDCSAFRRNDPDCCLCPPADPLYRFDDAAKRTEGRGQYRHHLYAGRCGGL